MPELTNYHGLGTSQRNHTHYQMIYLEVLEQQRKLLNEMNRSAEFNEELIRKYLFLMDVEEFKIREKQFQENALK